MESNLSFSDIIDIPSLCVVYMKGDLKKPILSFKPKVNTKFKEGVVMRILFNVSVAVTVG
jgi:hypothetical protein